MTKIIITRDILSRGGGREGRGGECSYDDGKWQLKYTYTALETCIHTYVHTYKRVVSTFTAQSSTTLEWSKYAHTNIRMYVDTRMILNTKQSSHFVT